MLTRIWVGFFIISFFSACVLFGAHGQTRIFDDMVASLFVSSKQSVEIVLGLLGTMCFWLGIFEIAKQAKLVDKLAWLMMPLFRRIMPEVPAHHPAHASMTMNVAANMLGLDNAATPMGLQAMRDLQTLNPLKETISNAQILFIVLNTSGLTLIPVTIFMYRAQLGSSSPTMVFIPILLATAASTLMAFLSVAWIQKIKIMQPVVMAYLLAFGLLLGGIVFYFSQLTAEAMLVRSQVFSNMLLMAIVIFFLGVGIWKKVDVYHAFIEGAKQGVQIAIQILPYFVAMLVAIALLRSSHVLDYFLQGIGAVVRYFGWDDAFVPAMSTAIMRPLSGSGARATMIDTMQHYGVDSFPGLVSAVVQGSTETTFYVLAVYFGAVGLMHGRYTLACALLADLVGIVSSVLLSYWFFT